MHTAISALVTPIFRRIGLLAAGMAVVAFVALLAASGSAGAREATCSGLGGIENHGQHIVGDYVTGLGGIGGGLEWPPAGGKVGDAVAGEGAAIPGGPGPGFHFPNGFAPGASFCLDHSQSPGNHL